ncbi:hypothetical protein Dimus_020375 [Dionaea muscipula]
MSRWYTEKFLKGQWDQEQCCVVEWQKYRECLSQHLDDKQLSRFLEVERGGFPDSSDSRSSVDRASTGSVGEPVERLVLG